MMLLSQHHDVTGTSLIRFSLKVAVPPGVAAMPRHAQCIAAMSGTVCDQEIFSRAHSATAVQSTHAAHTQLISDQWGAGPMALMLWLNLVI
jgi:hypothetical protein